MGPDWKGTLPLQTSPVHTWFCTTLASKEEGQPRAEPALCPQPDGALSPGGLLTVSPCFGSSLKPVKCPPYTYRGVWGTVWGQCCCCFPPILCTSDKISVFYTCMAGAVEEGRKVERNGWPTFFFSERWETKDDGRDCVLQQLLCQEDFSPPSALSSAEVELQLDAGTGFFRKEGKVGNVYRLARKLGGFSNSLSGCLFLQKSAKKHTMQLSNKLPNTGF